MLALLLLVIFLYKTRSKSYYLNSGPDKIYDTSVNAINQWEPDFEMYDSTEVNQGMRIALDSMKINPGEETIEKVKKIGHHLVANFHSSLGDPQAFVFNETPLQSYHSIKNKTTELYCTQYSLIFTFFCRINHIITRRIESYGKNDRHTFNEVYLPERNEWVYVDLTYNILYTKNENQYTSFIDLYRALYDSVALEKMSVLSYLDNRDTLLPASRYRDTLKYNFDTNCQFLYHFETNEKNNSRLTGKLNRYLKSESTFMYYSNVTVNNIYVYLKYIALVLIMFITFLIFKRNNQ